MSTVLDALRKAEEGKERGGGSYHDDLPPEPPRRRGPRWLWILLGGIALLVAFAGGLELSGSDPVPETVAVTDDQIEANDVAAVEPADPVEVAAVSKPALRTQPPPATRPKPRTKAKPRHPSPAQADVDARIERQTRVPVQLNAKPAGEGAAPEISEKRRKVLQRVMERREEREARRASRLASRQESQGLRDAIRSAATPEEREELLAEFREIRRVARAERKVAATERRLDIEEARALEGSPEAVPAPGAPPPPPPQVAAVAKPAPPPPAPAPIPAGATAPAVQTVVLTAPVEKGLRRPPSGAPQVRINILQWSSDPGRRFAYMSVEGNPAMTQVREGENYQGLTVNRIFPEKIEFAHGGSTFLLRAN